jgi:Ca2+-transporting ATPase
VLFTGKLPIIQMPNYMLPEIKGLTDAEAAAARKESGSNVLRYRKENRLLLFLLDMLKEPMIVLLLAAALLYAVNGEVADSIFLGVSILLVAAISGFQERKSRSALNALKKLSRPYCKVIRNGREASISSDDLVVGDVIVVSEGSMIPADGCIISFHDFSVNESMLTGESLPVFKSTEQEDCFIYRGTTVTSGLAFARLTATGNRTRLGAIGSSLEQIREERSPLEISIRSFVKNMAIAGALIFFVVWAINFYRNASLVDSLLKSLTLAMSILPEEIPVAFTSFMALAALRLMKKNIVVKQMKTVETLGSATVICTDKTGTITQNKMALAALYAMGTEQLYEPGRCRDPAALELLSTAMWASEPLPFDPMEIALHEAYGSFSAKDERTAFTLIHEYPLGGKPPMMTHVFEDKEHRRIIAAKGAPEALLALSGLSPAEKEKVHRVIDELAQQGYRILGVGTAAYTGYHFPPKQQDFSFSFKGLVAFNDPPKENIKQVMQDFYRAGVAVKIITGDNAATTRAIARSVGFRGYEQSVDGERLMQLNDRELMQCVQDNQVFTRMFPEAKLRVIDALKQSGAIVAMTGDGINDGPALKAAHIGIAMGKRGTEIARQAAALVLLDDDLSGMVDAIATGRKIYANLKKAIRYIISIHIPIILSVFIPLALGWLYPNILSPVHVVFLELIMGPTCSVIYENEPIEANAMQQKPRPYGTTFFSYRELGLSIVQGLIITMAVLAAYRSGLHNGYDEPATRTLVFVVLVTANILLTLVNRSFYYSIWVTLQYKNKLIPGMISVTVALVIAILSIPFLRQFFGLSLLAPMDYAGSILLGTLSVIWLEGWKWFRRRS